jgi:hypothetical protein
MQDDEIELYTALQEFAEDPQLEPAGGSAMLPSGQRPLKFIETLSLDGPGLPAAVFIARLFEGGVQKVATRSPPF